LKGELGKYSLASLTPQNISADTKNGSERTVPVSVRAAQLFALALANPLRPMDCDLVFFGDVGKTGLRAPYTIDKLAISS